MNPSFNRKEFTYGFVMLSILQSQFIEMGFKKTKNSVVSLFVFVTVVFIHARLL